MDGSALLDNNSPFALCGRGRGVGERLFLSAWIDDYSTFGVGNGLRLP